ncbi:MAG: metallophosphoesterase, partial [Eggerthellaceae bacterium]|nr:metallophosphoesterase [Eggerthellaceae bacterium]
MKTLVVGDLHLKQQFVLPHIDALLREDAAIGRVVFLGDACDDWGATEVDELDALEYQAQWVAAQRRRGLRVDVLLGNHDFCYIRGKSGPGSLMAVARELRAILEEKLQAQLACAVGPYLCTHAGLTNVWAKKFM